MADYTEISNVSVEPLAPVTSELMTSFRDNPIAIAEGALGAPYSAVNWHPYNGSNIGDGKDGLIYDYSVDGVVSKVETPLLDTKYEWSVVYIGLSHNYISGAELRAESRSRVSGTYGAPQTINSGVIGSTLLSGYQILPSGFAYGLSDVTQVKLYFSSGSIDNGKVYLRRKLIQYQL